MYWFSVGIPNIFSMYIANFGLAPFIPAVLISASIPATNFSNFWFPVLDMLFLINAKIAEFLLTNMSDIFLWISDLLDMVKASFITSEFIKFNTSSTGVPARIIAWANGLVSSLRPNRIIQSSFAISTCPFTNSLNTLEIRFSPNASFFPPNIIWPSVFLFALK